MLIPKIWIRIFKIVHFIQNPGPNFNVTFFQKYSNLAANHTNKLENWERSPPGVSPNNFIRNLFINTKLIEDVCCFKHQL